MCSIESWMFAFLILLSENIFMENISSSNTLNLTHLARLIQDHRKEVKKKHAWVKLTA